MLYDVIVAGGGAAGMTAAICAAQKGKKVLIIEKNKKLGKKLYATGNGRCNLSNKTFEMGCYSSDNEYFPYQVITSDSYKQVNEFFENLGVKVSDIKGYYYPASRQASTVVWALSDALRHYEVDIAVGECVNCIEIPAPKSFIVSTDKGEYKSSNLILACGGMAAPLLGGSDSGYQLCHLIGHPVTKLYPALCRLKTAQDVSSMNGVRAAAKAWLYRDEQLFATSEGELQISGDCLSGIMIFNLSGEAQGILAENAAAYIKLSFVPDMSTDEVKEFLRKFRLNHQDRTIHACINGLVHEKIGAYILNSLDLTKKKMSDINQEEENRIASALTESNFQVLGTGDYSEAQVTRGGADTRYVSASNMESRLHPGLFITGELLDVDGICGGYNIMWAILTGMKAGNGIND